LDNLEQFTSADAVVAELLTQAPQVVVIATSRRPLHVPAEHEHAVPPLELPTEEGLDAARRSGAVQLFLQQACKVRSNFKLTADNAADVAAVSRRLDGLPLAVELAAARSKLLSPRALLSRLDKALDMAAGGSQVPSRQKTLRDTIGWSYDLLTPELQVFCRRLGVFSGGADLYAISAVTSNQDEPDSADAFTLVADLVDASLVTVTETPDGEPRIGMLETVRAYGLDRLTASGELDAIRERHAHHYLGVAERLRPLMDGEQRLGARPRFEPSTTISVKPSAGHYSLAGPLLYLSMELPWACGCVRRSVACGITSATSLRGDDGRNEPSKMLVGTTGRN